MKKIIAFILMIFFTASCAFAQTKNSYLLKSKHQKTAAWIMLGGGTALVIAGG